MYVPLSRRFLLISDVWHRGFDDSAHTHAYKHTLYGHTGRGCATCATLSLMLFFGFFFLFSYVLAGVPTAPSQHRKEYVHIRKRTDALIWGRFLCSNNPVCWLLLHIPHLQVSLGAFHFRFAGWRRRRAAFRKSLASCLILLLQKKTHTQTSV